MISDLNDLISYTEKLASILPQLSDEIRIYRPGCPSDVIVALRQMVPRLPDSYLSVVESIEINGVAIGYFQLTPTSSSKINLAKKLREYNDPASTPMVQYYRRHGVYQVASWEADPIGVAYSDETFNIGQIVKFSAGNPARPPVVLADGFEQFLLIAANLDEIRGKFSDNSMHALRDFENYLGPLTADRRDEMYLVWKQIAKVVLE